MNNLDIVAAILAATDKIVNQDLHRDYLFNRFKKYRVELEELEKDEEAPI